LYRLGDDVSEIKAPPATLLRAGETCWKTVTAARASLLVDGAQYFSVLRTALLQARRSILIAGWDFDSRMLLLPANRLAGQSGEPDEAPLPLGEFLGYLLRTRPGLQIHVARWDYHWLFRDDREPDTRKVLEPLGVQFYDDRGHPPSACVHHKVVVIDDALAFCGGIDLTHERWDTSDHDPDDARRIGFNRPRYMPVHDTQLCLGGPVAAALGTYLRETWPAPENLPEPEHEGVDLWPAGLPVDFHNIRAGICRAREIASFYLAAIGATDRSLYVENQYFTSVRIAQALADQCNRVPTLEGLLVTVQRPKTPLELHTMGYGLTQFHRVLERNGIDRRVPLVAALTREKPINLHSKLALFDDRWLTCGSANLNRRSMGLDMECNVVLEAGTAVHRERMKTLRNRLIAEHVGMTLPEVAKAIRAYGLSGLPNLESRHRRLCYLLPHELQPGFGPILAPLFDRERQWL
jgi:phospholipase D1/2